MNKTLYQLAYRNIKKHKKHYTFMITFIFFITIFFHCFTIVQESSYLARKQYNEERYGTWFMSVEFTQETQEVIVDKMKRNPNKIRYGRWNDQGKVENDAKVGYLSDELYDLCHIPLVQGRQPQKENEIMLDKTYFQNNKYQLNQKIQLSLNGKSKSYHIVGVVEKSQDIFPDIYTDYKSLGTPYFVFDQNISVIHSTENTDYMDISGFIIPITSYNEFGYNHNPELEKYDLTITNTLTLIESMLISMIVLYALTSTSLKRRTKEFTLLRGIGMTTKQLIIMLFYENVISSFISVFIATILSLLISYGIVYIISFQTGIFIFQYHITNIILNVGIILLCTITSSLYPAFQSAKTALSGSFDSYQFRYIQIRYKKLKKQNVWHLALREMRAYKRMTIFLFIVFGLCSYMIITQTMPKYAENITKTFKNKSISWKVESWREGYKNIIGKLSENNLGEKNKIYFNDCNVEIKYKNDSYIPTGEIHISGSIFQLSDNSLFDDYSIQGRLPQNKNEVFVIPPISLDELQRSEDNGVDTSTWKSLGELTLGTRLTLGDNEIEVVGVCLPSQVIKFKDTYNLMVINNIYKYPSGLYVLPELYNESVNKKEDCIFYQEFYETEEQLNEIIEKLIHCGIDWYSIKDKIVYSRDIESLYVADFIQAIPMSTLISGIIISVIICYFLNKNETMNNMNDYALYRLIGMTKKDMLKKQLCKALVMSMSIFGFEVFWILIYSMFLDVFVDPYREMIVSIIGTFILSICVYCLPLVSLLKNNAIDIMNKSE